jgi:hypothetical protein
MTFVYLAGGIFCAVVLVYLVAALFLPEKF